MTQRRSGLYRTTRPRAVERLIFQSMFFAITAVILKISPGRALKTYGETYVELKSAIATSQDVTRLDEVRDYRIPDAA